jgi:hypothetical protein
MQENSAFEDLKADFVALQIHYKMLQERLNAALVVAPTREADYVKMMEKVQVSDFERAKDRQIIDDQAANIKKWSEYATHLEDEKATLLEGHKTLAQEHTHLKKSGVATANESISLLQAQVNELKKLNESQKLSYETTIDDLKKEQDALIAEKNTAIRQATLAKNEYDKLRATQIATPAPAVATPAPKRKLTFLQKFGVLFVVPALLLGWLAHAKMSSNKLPTIDTAANSKIQRYADYMANNNVNFHAFMKQNRFDEILTTLDTDIKKLENQPIKDLLEVQKQFYNTAKSQRENIADVVHKREDTKPSDVFLQETSSGGTLKSKGAAAKLIAPKTQTPTPPSGTSVGVTGIPSSIEIYNTVDGATVRAGFEREAGIVGKVKKGVKCQVLDRSPQKLKRTLPIDGKDSEMEEYAYKIKFKSGGEEKEGWVYGFYVKVE